MQRPDSPARAPTRSLRASDHAAHGALRREPLRSQWMHRVTPGKVCVRMLMPSFNEETAASSSATAQANNVPIPNDALIIVPVRNAVLFPGVVAPITIARPKSIAAAQQALREQRPVGILLQRNPEADDPGPDELNRICTVAN